MSRLTPERLAEIREHVADALIRRQSESEPDPGVFAGVFTYEGPDVLNVNEPAQATLSDAIFRPLTRSRKPAVKISISGNDTLDLDGDGGFDSLISGPGDGTVPTLDDGMVVQISGWGYVQKVGQEQTQKGESIVVVGLKLKGFDGLKITGEMYDPEADDD